MHIKGLAQSEDSQHDSCFPLIVITTTLAEEQQTGKLFSGERADRGVCLSVSLSLRLSLPLSFPY